MFSLPSARLSVPRTFACRTQMNRIDCSRSGFVQRRKTQALRRSEDGLPAPVCLLQVGMASEWFLCQIGISGKSKSGTFPATGRVQSSKLCPSYALPFWNRLALRPCSSFFRSLRLTQTDTAYPHNAQANLILRKRSVLFLDFYSNGGD